MQTAPYRFVTESIIIAVAAVLAAAVLGSQLKVIGSGQQTISVKGLAEKSVRADQVEWTISLNVNGSTFVEALAKLRKEKPSLDQFLDKAGIDVKMRTDSREFVEPHMVDEELPGGRSRQVQKGFDATQTVTISSTDLDKVIAANNTALQFEADGHPISYSAPRFLVSNLEEIKMSLIGAATRNARTRADEFAKNGGVAVGSMRSASQGAFYILAKGSTTESTDYGGIYDKSTVDKVARVVVTIEYNIER